MSTGRTQIFEMTPAISKLFEERGLYQERRGMWARQPTGYRQRWKDGTKLRIGERAIVEPWVCVAEGREIPQVGAFSELGSAFPKWASIGRYVAVGEGVTFMGFRHPIEAVSLSSAFFNDRREFMDGYGAALRTEGDSLPPMPDISNPQPQNAPLTIGHDVWIGAGAVLRGGITIGTGAVIAGGAVLTRDVAPYTVVGGSPARVLRPRFEAALASDIAATEWWTYELADLYTLPMGDPKAFLKAFEKAQPTLRVNPPATRPLWEIIKEHL